jgi:hypothetical protein
MNVSNVFVIGSHHQKLSSRAISTKLGLCHISIAMQISVIHDCTKKHQAPEHRPKPSIHFFPNSRFLRRLGLLGEQEAVTLLEGDTVAGVLVVGGEASGVAVKRLEAEIFGGRVISVIDAHTRTWRPCRQQPSSRCRCACHRGRGCTFITLAKVLVHFLASSWRLSSGTRGNVRGSQSRQTYHKMHSKAVQISNDSTMMKQRICARVQRTYLAVVVVVDS